MSYEIPHGCRRGYCSNPEKAVVQRDMEDELSRAEKAQTQRFL